jgi:hypothetical protein
LIAGYVGLVLPTNLLLMIILGFGIATRHPDYYWTKDEANGIGWLRTYARTGAVILADERMGLYLPAQTGLKVIYGHAYETPHAQENLALISACTNSWSPVDCNAVFDRYQISYVWSNQGPISVPDFLQSNHLTPVYSSTQVVIYEVQ